jgi:hypothetical protein
MFLGDKMGEACCGQNKKIWRFTQLSDAYSNTCFR